MSRANAAAPSPGADTRYRGPEQTSRALPPRRARRLGRPQTTTYVERALLLWPRLDRSRLRKLGDDPSRIAELVERRTSQPFEVILAMLTRQTDVPLAAKDAADVEAERSEQPRVALRIVRDEETGGGRLSKLLIG